MWIHILQMLVSEIEMKQSKIDECQKYAEQYSAAVKVINTDILRILIFCHYRVECWPFCVFYVFIGLWVADYDLQSYGWFPTKISSETTKNAKLIRLHYSRGKLVSSDRNIFFLKIFLLWKVFFLKIE